MSTKRKSNSRRPLKKLASKGGQSAVLKASREQAEKSPCEVGEYWGKDKVLEQAKKLALEAKESDPAVSKVYWFPDDEEVRLVEVHENTVVSLSGEVEPFYFDATMLVPVPSGIALIRPEEFGKLTMPEGWGNWKDGLELVVGIEP